jgi:hypothetical protein
MVNLYRRLTVSEQKADQIVVESGSLDAAQAVSNSPVRSEPASASESAKETTQIDAPGLVPEQGAAGEAAAASTPKADAIRIDAPKADTSKAEAAKAEAPRAPGKVMIMSSGDRAWERSETGSEAQTESSQDVFGKRRIGAMAAVVMLAAMAGALGGVLATVGYTHFAGADDAASGGSRALEASMARIDTDMSALKLSVEHTSKIGMSQFNKTSERLDKVEKAQAEPAAKLARLSEAVDKLRAAPAAAPVPVAAAPAKEITGSIAPAAAVAAAAPKADLKAEPKSEVARLPTIDGWVLRDIGHGGALIQSRREGVYEVYAGDFVPSLGRIDAVRKQDGHWVVVTSKGLIVAR